jgi:hypothetical protein
MNRILAMARVTIPQEQLRASSLPAICLLTGAREGVAAEKVELHWDGREAGVGLLDSLRSPVWTVSATLPFEARAFTRWQRADHTTTGLLVTAGGCLLLAMLGALGRLAIEAEIPVALWESLIVAGGAGSVVVALAGLGVRLLSRRVRVLRVKDGVVELEIPSAVAANAIQEHLAPKG